MRKTRAGAIALVVLVVAGCMGNGPQPSNSAPGSPTSEGHPVLRFVVMGDAGTGEADQSKVAQAIATVCAKTGCDFALELGDNIYDAGASSANDPQFDSKFERPYANLTMPFWLVLGNHDNSQDPAGTGATAGLGTWYDAGNNEVAYSARTDRASDKWHLPARYYTLHAWADGSTAAVLPGATANATEPAPVIDFFGLDTNTLVFEDVPFPPDLAAAVRGQTDWIDGAVAASRAPWKIALGHHPYLSNGPHGNAGAYDGHAGVPGLSGDYLKQFFESHLCGKVDLSLAGHDHDLEWLDPAPDCGATAFVVSGGGGAQTYALSGSDTAAFQKQSLGFWLFEANSTALQAMAYDENGRALFATQLGHEIS
jgi:tartrate-resistant acid phosphatase type 5